MPPTDPPQQLTEAELVSGFQRIGLHPGDKVIVHSSLKSFGPVQGGAPTVIHALQQALTPHGTLLMPSFNHYLPWSPGGEGYYDPTHTPTTNGAIPEAFRQMPNVFRSLNPSHPFACWGKNAQRYIQFHHRTLTLGPDSPLGMLARDGGLALLLGVDYRANTYHHVVEMTLGAPCLGYRTEAYPVRLPDGRMVTGRTWGWRAKPCPINDSTRYAPLMAPHESRAHIGACQTILFKLRDAAEIISRALRHGLDECPPCHQCPIRPRLTPHTVETDWNPITNTPQPNSTAWTY